jgi:hypothetical protein
MQFDPKNNDQVDWSKRLKPITVKLEIPVTEATLPPMDHIRAQADMLAAEIAQGRTPTKRRKRLWRGLGRSTASCMLNQPLDWPTSRLKYRGVPMLEGSN